MPHNLTCIAAAELGHGAIDIIDAIPNHLHRHYAAERTGHGEVVQSDSPSAIPLRLPTPCGARQRVWQPAQMCAGF